MEIKAKTNVSGHNSDIQGRLGHWKQTKLGKGKALKISLEIIEKALVEGNSCWNESFYHPKYQNKNRKKKMEN